jgi:hypothetical protein
MTSHRTGVLIIRAWTEPGSAQPLRAQIRMTDDISVGGERAVTVVEATEVDALVSGWLQEFLATT